MFEGKTIQEWRELGVTVSALARRAGVSRRTVYNWIDKEKASPQRLACESTQKREELLATATLPDPATPSATAQR